DCADLVVGTIVGRGAASADALTFWCHAPDVRAKTRVAAGAVIVRLTLADVLCARLSANAVSRHAGAFFDAAVRACTKGLLFVFALCVWVPGKAKAGALGRWIGSRAGIGILNSSLAQIAKVDPIGVALYQSTPKGFPKRATRFAQADEI